MTPTGRRVRCLRLRAASSESAQRFRIALEDALHTASLPAAETGRVVVIRRLPLGRLPPHLSSTALALRLEQATRALALQALPAGSPAAAQAEAVAFADRTEVLARLLDRLLRHAPLSEWFWRAALPDWNPRGSRLESIAWVLDQAHALPEAAVSIGALLASILTSPAAPDLITAVPRGQGRRWLRRLGFSPSATPPAFISDQAPSEVTSPPAPHPSLTLLREASPILAAWGQADDRSQWLATVLLLRDQPARGADPRLPQRALAWLQTEFPRPPVTPRIEQPGSETALLRPLASAPDLAALPAPAATSEFAELPHLDRSGEAAETPTHAAPLSRLHRADNRSRSAPTTSTTTVAGPTERVAARENSLALPGPTAGPHLATTNAGGLLFLVAVLNRIGLPAHLAAESSRMEHGWGPRLLLDLAARVGVPLDDPLVWAVRELPGASTPNARGDAEVLREWRIRVRRWCRRELRLGLWNLIRRRGRMAAGATHLEVCFDLDQTDLRLRRAGLDLDPGWVPWLGRVVQFHYL